VRPAGISSTDAEHDAALELARHVVEKLTAEAWPHPIYADSGNGAHLMYSINLPAEDGGLLKRCLEALDSRYSTAEVKVDTTTCNPARIWKLYGTPSAKGDDTDDRPHRMSRIIEIPTALELVPIDLLRALSGSASKPEPPPRTDVPPRQGHDNTHSANSRANNGSFDLAKWIADHNLDVGERRPRTSLAHVGPSLVRASAAG
jgi:hypothetical protein